MNTTASFQLYAVGAKFTDDGREFPAEELSLGWDNSSEEQILFLGDPKGQVTEEALSTAPMRLGFVQFGPLIIVLVKAPTLRKEFLEAITVYIHEAKEPAIDVEMDMHLMWTLMVVDGARNISAMRTFTTNPEVTKFLRKAYIEQCEAGPISKSEAMEWINRWYAEVPSDSDAWSRVVVSSKIGD